jgi:daunorubicin resistance ABC transporter ATP-binding subunit
MSDAIEVQDLVKVYPGGNRAVDGLSLRIRAGEVFGLLGPNGSGKTTTVRILVTLLARTSGTARVGGHDVTADIRKVREIIGYAGQTIGIDDDLTARENLVLQGRLHRMSGVAAEKRAAELLEIMSLTQVADVRAARFSGGMRRRLDLVQALVHAPPVLFLDEPTTGMDPQSRLALWQYLDRLRRDGVTILLTTQYLEEADRACDRVAIMDRGKLLRSGSPAAMKDELGADRVTFTLTSALAEDAYDRAAHVVGRYPEVARVEQVEPLVLSVRDTGAALPTIIRHLESEYIRILTVRNSAVTLDDVFLRYTGHKVRADPGLGRPAMSAAFAAMHGGKVPQ